MLLKWVKVATSKAWTPDTLFAKKNVLAREPECFKHLSKKTATHSHRMKHSISSHLRVNLESSERRPISIFPQGFYPAEHFPFFSWKKAADLRILCSYETQILVF